MNFNQAFSDDLKNQSVLIGYRGSIAHGTYVPKSNPNSIDDKDVMAIIIPPIEYYFGLEQFGNRGTKEIKKEEWDIVVYEIRKFISLLKKGNPNVLCLLWLQPNHYIKITDVGKLLISKRNLFVSRQAYHSFVGYAYGQLKRMEQFEKHGHMGSKRRELIQQYGYDTKNAAHLIRLLRMGIEFLKDGELYVQRKDASQLLDIKTGKWTLDQVKSEASRLFVTAEQAYLLSNLPPFVDNDAINDLMVKIIYEKLQGSTNRT